MPAAKQQMKAMSLKMAQMCETAQGQTCHCRCKGALHGRANEAGQPGQWENWEDIPLKYFQDLPKDDPHHLPTEEEKAERRKLSYEERKTEKKLQTRAKWHKYSDCEVFEPIQITETEAKEINSNLDDWTWKYQIPFKCGNCGRLESIYK